MHCAVCGNGIEVTDTSCSNCSSIPIPSQLLKMIGLLVVTQVRIDEEIQWWQNTGAISAFRQANPKLFENDRDDFEYIVGNLVTSNDITSLNNDWLEKARSMVESDDSDSEMLQYGGMRTEVPSGIVRHSYVVNYLVYATPSGQVPKTNVVAINRQIFPV